MQPLDLNLASRPFRNNAPLWIAHAVGIAGLVALTTWNVRAALVERERMAQTREASAAADRALASLDEREQRAREAIRAVDVDDLADKAIKANDFLARRALSWTRLFNLLEKVQPYEVRMTSIRPIFEQPQRGGRQADAGPVGSVPVGVDGKAQSLEAFLEFERALLLDPHFARVEPERTNFDPSGEVRFGLRFLYDPEGKLDAEGAPSIPPVLAAVAEEEAERAARRDKEQEP